LELVSSLSTTTTSPPCRVHRQKSEPVDGCSLIMAPSRFGRRRRCAPPILEGSPEYHDHASAPLDCADVRSRPRGSAAAQARARDHEGSPKHLASTGDAPSLALSVSLDSRVGGFLGSHRRPGLARALQTLGRSKTPFTSRDGLFVAERSVTAFLSAPFTQDQFFCSIDLHEGGARHA
jgi:hypothetical protein